GLFFSQGQQGTMGFIEVEFLKGADDHIQRRQSLLKTLHFRGNALIRRGGRRKRLQVFRVFHHVHHVLLQHGERDSFECVLYVGRSCLKFALKKVFKGISVLKRSLQFIFLPQQLLLLVQICTDFPS